MKRLEIVVLSLCAVLQGACAAEGTPPVQLPDAPAAAAAPAQVVALTVTSSAVRQPVRGSGSAVAARMANLGAPVTARVERVHISAGDQVEAGQLLIELDDRQARLRAQQADAAASAAKLQADQLEADYARLAPLAARGSIAASRAEQLRAQADVAAASARGMATAARSAARAVTEAEVRAPFAATVLAVPVEEGEMATMVPPTTVARLADLTTLDVRVRLAERDLRGLREGAEVRARLPNLDRDVVGVLHHVGQEVEEATRTVEVVVRIPNEGARIPSGAFTEIAIVPSQAREAIVVPTSAVLEVDGHATCYLIVGGVVSRRDVTAVALDADRIEVTEGLEVGDAIVRERLDALVVGATVVATEGPPPGSDGAATEATP